MNKLAETCCITRGVDSGEKTLIDTSAMNANSHGTAKRGEKHY